MTAAAVTRLLALLLVAGAVLWMGWPRPDVEIRVARGGIATVINHFGLRHPLGDTVFVGGAGARRSVRVVNQDTVQHVLAMFTVKPASQMDYVVPPGTFGGFCSAHATSKRLTVVVQ